MRWFLILLFLNVISIGCKKSSDPQKQNVNQAPKPTSVEAIVTKAEELSENIVIPGTLFAAEQINIHPEISGMVSKILFKDGQEVIKNQLLVQLNDEEQVAKLNKLRIQEEILKLNEKRQSDLLDAKAIGKSEYETSLLQYKNILSDINILNSEIRKYSIRAAFSGILGFRNISLGDFINSNTIVTTLTQVNPLKLKFSVPEQYINRVHLNQKISFKCEPYSQSNTATVNFISPYLNQETKNLEILAQVDENTKELRPGLYSSIDLKLSNKTNSLMIPSQCIIPRIKDKQVVIYKNGKIAFSTITIGYRDSSRVEIISGLQSGDTIITTGLMKLKEGSSVQLNFKN